MGGRYLDCCDGNLESAHSLEDSRYAKRAYSSLSKAGSHPPSLRMVVRPLTSKTM